MSIIYIYFFIYTRYVYVICIYTHIHISLCPRTRCAPVPVSARLLPRPTLALPPLAKIDPPPAWTAAVHVEQLRPAPSLWRTWTGGSQSRGAASCRSTLLHIPQSIPNQRHYMIETGGEGAEGGRERVDRRQPWSSDGSGECLHEVWYGERFLPAYPARQPIDVDDHPQDPHDSARRQGGIGAR